MRLMFVVVAGAMIAGIGCSNNDPLSPKSLAGNYPLAQVNGNAPGTYFQVQAVSCTAAFTGGNLEFKTDGSFSMEALFLINDVEMIQP